MAMTIEVDEILASRLQAQAAARRQSPEDFARVLLGSALQKIDEDELWIMQNERRIELIRKSTAATLTTAEADELQALQDLADQRLEARDRQLLEQLERFREEANNLDDNGN